MLASAATTVFNMGNYVRAVRVSVGQIDHSKSAQPEKITPAENKRPFRDKPATLSYPQVKAMLQDNDFFCKDFYDLNKEFSNPQGRGFANQFEKQQNGNVIFDRASGLMWEQSGSSNLMMYYEVEKYVRDLNAKNFAGYNNWRLPTLEEAMSLMEPKDRGDYLYIDLLFDNVNSGWNGSWTADKDSAGVPWVVEFSHGYCEPNPDTRAGSGLDTGYNFVRVVR